MNEEMAYYTNSELDELAREREQAERDGIWDDAGNPNLTTLTEDQEYDLWMAASTLSRLAQETNSTVSELLDLGSGDDYKPKSIS